MNENAEKLLSGFLDPNTERYGDRIFIFDAINEAINGVSGENSPYVDDIVRIAFEIAGRHLPKAQLVLNDDQYWWVYRRELTNCYLIAKDIIQRGVRIGGLGFQYHMFDWNLRDADRSKMNNNSIQEFCNDGRNSL